MQDAITAIALRELALCGTFVGRDCVTEGTAVTLALLAFDGIGTSTRDAAIQDTVATGIAFLTRLKDAVATTENILELAGDRAVRPDLTIHVAVITLLQCLLDAIAAEHIRVAGSVRRRR